MKTLPMFSAALTKQRGTAEIAAPRFAALSLRLELSFNMVTQK